MHINCWQLAAGVAVAAVVGLLAPAAAADGTVVLGGGAGITVNGTPCTLATIGHDNTGQLVLLLAGVVLGFVGNALSLYPW
jgi:hypothetical protein